MNEKSGTTQKSGWLTKPETKQKEERTELLNYERI
jgi:hypothetical protein